MDIRIFDPEKDISVSNLFAEFTGEGYSYALARVKEPEMETIILGDKDIPHMEELLKEKGCEVRFHVFGNMEDLYNELIEGVLSHETVHSVLYRMESTGTSRYLDHVDTNDSISYPTLEGKMFTCVVCGKKVQERERFFENLDWCAGCIGKDGEIMVRECSTDRFAVYTRLPFYVTYRNMVPEEIKKKILNG